MTEPLVTELADVPAGEVILKCAAILMSSAAEKLGLAEDGSPVDLDEARRVITALAGLVTASAEYLNNDHARPLRNGLKQLQLAFRELSPYPDELGKGPGEKLTGFVRA